MAKKDRENNDQHGQDQGQDQEEMLQALLVGIVRDVIAEDGEQEEKVKTALREIVEEKLGDIEDEIKSELANRVEEIDFEKVKEDAIQGAVSKVIEKLHEEDTAAAD
jgi:hypothetical protein